MLKWIQGMLIENEKPSRRLRALKWRDKNFCQWAESSTSVVIPFKWSTLNYAKNKWNCDTDRNRSCLPLLWTRKAKEWERLPAVWFLCLAVDLLQKELGVASSSFVWDPASRKGFWEQLTQSLQVGILSKTCDPGGHFLTPCQSPSSTVDKGTDPPPLSDAVLAITWLLRFENTHI